MPDLSWGRWSDPGLPSLTPPGSTWRPRNCETLHESAILPECSLWLVPCR
jgi:hypothetical protein